ncbi:unnamed protein product [Amoebophrya sp. A120]|nr:unnamed protein product [Amoebophrya sp. A120]|eukprot:GSA120T00018392001.1
MQDLHLLYTSRYDTLAQDTLRLNPDQVRYWWQVIEDRYCEVHRRYHTLEHLAFLLRKLEDETARLKGGILLTSQDLRDLQLAVFFHDLVYDPARQDNEEVSARIFESDFYADVQKVQFQRNAQLLEDKSVRRVARWIRETAGHKHDRLLADKDLVGSLFLDLDLSILALPDSEGYERYTKSVAFEYTYSVLSPDCFTLGRLNFLSSLLPEEPEEDPHRVDSTSTAPDLKSNKKASLQLFGPLHEDWESLAVANCEWERDKLKHEIRTMSALRRSRAKAELFYVQRVAPKISTMFQHPTTDTAALAIVAAGSVLVAGVSILFLMRKTVLNKQH